MKKNNAMEGLVSKTLHLSFVAFSTVFCITNASAKEKKPNILCIIAEDICPNLGCYGDPNALTPNIDRLAAEGVRFDCAFSHGSTCAPARTTLILGCSPVTIGAQQMRNNVIKPESIRILPEFMQDAGYFCAINKTDFNFESPYNKPKKPGDTVGWDAHIEGSYFSAGKELSESLVKALSKRQKGQPFFAMCTLGRTHESQYGYPTETKAAQRLCKRLTHEQLCDRSKLQVPPFLPDAPGIRETLGQYYDAIAEMDAQVGDILEWLEQEGQAENTIIFFFGDNGMGMTGGKGTLWDEGLHVPLIVRVPKKWSNLSPQLPGTVSKRLVSFEDFAPSTLSLIGQTKPSSMTGQSFLGQEVATLRSYVYGVRDRVDTKADLMRSVRDEHFLYIRNFMPFMPFSPKHFAILCAPTFYCDWRDLYNQGKLPEGRVSQFYTPTRPSEELYDIVNDPYQLHNLANNSSFKNELERLRKECTAWMRKNHDTGLLPESEMYRRAECRSSNSTELDSLLNPIDKLLEVSAMTMQMNEQDLPKIKTLMKDSDAAIRWWAVAGLLGLGDKASLAQKQLEVALEDESFPVRIAAAEVLCKIGMEDKALPVLIDGLLQREDALIAAESIDALERLGKKALPALPVLHEMAQGKNLKYGNNYVRNVGLKIPAIFITEELGHPIDYPKKLPWNIKRINEIHERLFP